MTVRTLEEINARAQSMCAARNKPSVAVFAGEACSWLHACGYQGLPLLQDALNDETQSLNLVRDALGLDLHNVSCLFIATELHDYVTKNGRVFLRNVRHGLFLVPNSVTYDYAVGCPIDPSFALGGERIKNPYLEKLEAAKMKGVEIDDAIWSKLLSAD